MEAAEAQAIAAEVLLHHDLEAVVRAEAEARAEAAALPAEARAPARRAEARAIAAKRPRRAGRLADEIRGSAVLRARRFAPGPLCF